MHNNQYEQYQEIDDHQAYYEEEEEYKEHEKYTHFTPQVDFTSPNPLNCDQDKKEEVS